MPSIAVLQRPEVLNRVSAAACHSAAEVPLTGASRTTQAAGNRDSTAASRSSRAAAHEPHSQIVLRRCCPAATAARRVLEHLRGFGSRRGVAAAATRGVRGPVKVPRARRPPARCGGAGVPFPLVLESRGHVERRPGPRVRASARQRPASPLRPSSRSSGPPPATRGTYLTG